ncbi:unnamed protein product, partial [Iphiclides podalirius]
MVPNAFSAPLVNAATFGAAVGAFKGALNGAAVAGAGAAVAKNVDAIVKFIGSKALGALAAKGAFLKGIALKSAVHGATLGAGVAIGAAVASHKPHVFDHGTGIEHHDAPILLESFPSYHEEHLHESAPALDAALFHQQTHEVPYGEFAAYHGSAPSTLQHPQQYVEDFYR